MKKTLPFLLFLAILEISCQKESAIPVPNNSLNPQDTSLIIDPKDSTDINPQDTTITTDPSDTTAINPQDTVVTQAPIPSTIQIKFLINFYDDAIYQNATFRVYDDNWIKYATLTSANIIAVNTESWACNSIHKVITYTDNNYTINKSYHLTVTLFLGSTSIITNDFTFQVDSLGNIFNMQTQNGSYVENKFGVPINDITVMCNTIIINHRRMTGSYPQDPRIQGDL